MSSAYIDTDHASVRLRSERLAVFAPHTEGQPDRVLHEIPLLGLEQLCLREHVQLTAEALCALFKAEVPVHYVDWRGDCLGTAMAPSTAESVTRLRQYQRTIEAAFALAQARALVEAKTHNQLRLLQRLNAKRRTLEEDPLQRLDALRRQTQIAPDLPSLRGVEGAAAALYFPLWAAFLPSDFPFEHRSIRPPHNAVNACISFAAALVYHDVVAALHTRGLDPGLGLLHETENGRWSLALDLMEPFRPALCDALTVRLLNYRILASGDFEPHEGGVYLNREGRKQLIQHYERRLDRSFLSDQAGHRTTLRQAIEAQVVSYKSALAEGTGFKPFRLN